MKRLIVMSVALCILLSFVACGNETGVIKDNDGRHEKISLDDFEWQNSENGIEITNYTGDATHVIVPDTIENKKVVSIGNAFSGNVIVETLVLSKNIEKLDGDSLKNCDNLKRLEGPSVSHITDSLKLKKLEELVLPSLESLNLESVEDCNSLRYLEIPNVEYIKSYRSSNKEMLYWPDALEEVVIPSVMWIRTQANYYDWDDKDPGYPPIGGMVVPSELKYDEDTDIYDFRCGNAYSEITEETANELYCYFFQTVSITVNGVRYNLDD